MKITVVKTRIYDLPKGKQLSVKTDDARYTCTDESLFDDLAEGATVDVELDGQNIVGVIKEAPAPAAKSESTPAAESPKAAPKTEPAKGYSYTPKPKTQAAAPKEEPAAVVEETTEAPELTPDTVAPTTSGLTENDQVKPNDLFPLLKAEEIELRIGQIFDWGVTLLLYKDARCDQNRLDAKYTPFGWQKSYHSIDGRLYCTVSVKDPNTGEWISKSDVGTESNTEAEKGQASDAFKRACVCWGSGRELYTAPAITIKAADTVIERNSKGKVVCKDNFSVRSISYDSQRNINALTIYSEAKKKVVFSWKK